LLEACRLPNGPERVWLVGWMQLRMVQEAHEQLQRFGRVTLDMPCGTGTAACTQDL